MEMDTKPSLAQYRGISCTGSWMFQQWAPPERTIILERPVEEVNASLRRLGLPEVSDDQFRRLPGVRVPHDALFDGRAKEIWEFLLPSIPFNAERHALLAAMFIQPDFSIPPDTSALRRVMQELAHG